MNSLKKNIIAGSLWSVMGQFMSYAIILLTNMWLARILSPSQFGQMGIIMFFIILANVFTEGGLAGALIRKKDVTQEDYSTVFVFNLAVSIFCFLLLVAGSGYIADYYNDGELKHLLVAAGGVLLINAFQITQNARLVRDLKFKQKSIYFLSSVILGSVAGITAAYNQFGVWSLVVMQLVTAFSSMLIFWIFEGVFFKFDFNKKSFKGLYTFGVNTTLALLINTAFDNIYQLVLGRHFSINQVGYYYQAKKLQDVPGGVLNMVTQSVLFSSLSKLQDDKPAFRRAYNRISDLILVLLGFVSCLVYIYATQIIELLYGQRWLGSVFYIQLLTIASFFYFQELINRIIFKVFDKTQQILYLEILKKIIQSISIIIGILSSNLFILILGFVITSMIGYFVNYYYSQRVAENDIGRGLIALLKVAVIGIFCVVILMKLNLFLSGYVVFITVPILMIIYFGGLYIAKVFDPIKIYKEFKELRK